MKTKTGRYTKDGRLAMIVRGHFTDRWNGNYLWWPVYLDSGVPVWESTNSSPSIAENNLIANGWRHVVDP